MKKFLSILLVLCLILTSLALYSCDFGKKDDDDDDDDDDSKPLTTAEIIENAVNETVEIKAAEVKLDLDVSVGMQGVTIAVPVDAVLKAADGEASFDMELSFMGETMEINVYTDGEWLYILEGGNGSKMLIPYQYLDNLDEADIPFDSLDDAMSQIPEGTFDGVEVEENDGETELSITFTKKDYPEIYDGIAYGMAQTGYAIDADDVSDINVAVVISEDGYFKALSVEFSVDAVIEGQNAKIDVKLAVEATKVGKGVSVTPIPGCENFQIEG